jgi:hypothetical protein
MEGFMKILRIFAVIIAIIVIICGCAQKSTTIISPENQLKQITDINYKPYWLLIGGIDIKEKITDHSYEVVQVNDNVVQMKLTQPLDTYKWDFTKGPVMEPGDIIRTSRFKAGDYEIIGDPEITISSYHGGKIIYWGGKGSITNYKAKERISLPDSVGMGAALPSDKKASLRPPSVLKPPVPRPLPKPSPQSLPSNN